MGLLKTLLVEEHEVTETSARELSKGAMKATTRGESSSWRLGSAEAAMEAARSEAAQAVAEETRALLSLVRCPSCLERLPAAFLRLGLSLLLESPWFGALCGVAAGVVIMIAVEENARYWASTHPWFGMKLFITLGILGWWAVKMVRRPRLADASVRWLSQG